VSASDPRAGAEQASAGVPRAEGGVTASGVAAPAAGGDPSEELQPLSWSTGRIIIGGTAAWVVALVVTLVVPALHTGDRSWWPWCCVAGIALGAVGFSYVRRGRGNAVGAR
jgi:hypothetical protein